MKGLLSTGLPRLVLQQGLFESAPMKTEVLFFEVHSIETDNMSSPQKVAFSMIHPLLTKWDFLDLVSLIWVKKN